VTSFSTEAEGEEFTILLTPVTRVTPVGNGGKFSKEAKEIYSLVLKMQTVRYSTVFLTNK
jgi:Xaa-Pro aminopeptidase